MRTLPHFEYFPPKAFPHEIASHLLTDTRYPVPANR